MKRRNFLKSIVVAITMGTAKPLWQGTEAVLIRENIPTLSQSMGCRIVSIGVDGFVYDTNLNSIRPDNIKAKSEAIVPYWHNDPKQNDMLVEPVLNMVGSEPQSITLNFGGGMPNGVAVESRKYGLPLGRPYYDGDITFDECNSKIAMPPFNRSIHINGGCVEILKPVEEKS